MSDSDAALSNDELLDVAVEAASDAAQIVDEAIGGRGSLVWKQKGESDFVTKVDTDSETAIVKCIRSHFPDAVIIGEELSPTTEIGRTGLAFVVDPLDGTTNFLHGFPEYAVSIAAVRDGELVAAVVRSLTRPEIFTAVKDGGAFVNGEPINVSTQTEPYRSLIGTGFPFKRHDLLEKYARLAPLPVDSAQKEVRETESVTFPAMIENLKKYHEKLLSEDVIDLEVARDMANLSTP